MTKSLSEKLKSGIDYVKGNAGKAFTIGSLGLASVLYSNDANAQSYNVKDHDKGAKVINYKPEVSDKSVIETKLWGNDRVLIHYIDENKYNDDTDFAALRADSTGIFTGLTSEKVTHMTNYEGSFAYREAKDNNGKPLTTLELCSPCNDYGPNFNSSKAIEQLKAGTLIPDQQRFVLGDGRIVLPFEVPENMKNQTDSEGNAKYMDHIIALIDPKKDNIFVGENPRTRNLEIKAKFYRPTKEKILETDSTTESTYVPVNMSSDEAFDPSGFSDSKESKQWSSDFALGGNTNFNLAEAQASIRYGPFAVGVNAGKKFGKETTETQTEPSELTGNFGYGKITKENKSVFGAFGELHFRPNKSFDPFVGAGMNFWTNELEVVDGIKNSSGTWKPGSPQINSTTENEKSYRFTAGAELGKLKLSAGWDTLEGMIGNVSVSLPISGGNK